MYHHISNMKTTFDRKVYSLFSKVTLHDRSTVAISIKLINHEHKKNKTLVKPIDQTILPRTDHIVLEELQNILTSEVENLRMYAKQMDATLTFRSLPEVEVQSETTHPQTDYMWRFLSRRINLKIRLEISFILKDKTREDVEQQDHLVKIPINTRSPVVELI